MSKDWVADIKAMHDFYGHSDKFAELDIEKLKLFLKFRIDFLQEELDEMKDATGINGAEDVVDALIDLCVVAIGTLDAFGIRSYEAWDKVLKANMAKKSGIKEGRPNPLGLPDLMKPEGWEAPSHASNHGRLPFVFAPPAPVQSPCAI